MFVSLILPSPFSPKISRRNFTSKSCANNFTTKSAPNSPAPPRGSACSIPHTKSSKPRATRRYPPHTTNACSPPHPHQPHLLQLLQMVRQRRCRYPHLLLHLSRDHAVRVGGQQQPQNLQTGFCAQRGKA